MLFQQSVAPNPPTKPPIYVRLAAANTGRRRQGAAVSMNVMLIAKPMMKLQRKTSSRGSVGLLQ